MSKYYFGFNTNKGYRADQVTSIKASELREMLEGLNDDDEIYLRSDNNDYGARWHNADLHLESMDKAKPIRTINYRLNSANDPNWSTEEENKEYWTLLRELRDNGKWCEGEWNGDYYVNTYLLGGLLYKVWENMELGVQSEIEIFEPTEQELYAFTSNDTDYFTKEEEN